jgi:ParB-like nuclease domain
MSEKFSNEENWHEASKIYPLIEGEEFDALVQDIRLHGLKNPIVVYKDKASGKELLLDGRNRILACKKAGVKPAFEIRTLKNESPVEWVISQNSRRRHLKPGQLAMVALAAEKIFAAEAKERQRTLNTKEKAACANISTSEKGRASEKAEKLLGVSHAYITKAKAVQAANPKLAEKVKEGKLSLPEAERQIFPSPEKKTCTLTEKNIEDTRSLSMAKERLWYLEGKVELLLHALRHPKELNKDAEVRKVLKVYLRAFRDFENFLKGGIAKIERAIK